MASPLPKERGILIKHYAKLTSTVRDVDNLLPHFVTARIINSDDMDEIKAVPRTSEKVAKLLKFISGPLDAGFTTSYYNMLDIMYYYGNNSTKELAVAMGKKEEVPSATPTSPTAKVWQRQSGSVSSSSSVYSPTRGNADTAHINPEVEFDEEDSGKGIIDDGVMEEKKKAVCRISASQMTGTGFIGYLGVKGGYFNVLVTNHHVIQTVEDAMCCRLKFENAFDRGQHCTVKLCDAIAEAPNFWTSPVNKLDFTIIRLKDERLKDTSTDQLLDINPIILSKPADIKNKDQIYVIQYPHGGNLSLSASSCCLLGPLLLYKSGTSNGSSGSPVLKEVNGNLVPVALHRGGAPNSQLYKGCNFGTLISEILKCITGQQYLSLPTQPQVQAVLAEHL